MTDQPIPAGDLLDLPIDSLGPMSTRLRHCMIRGNRCETVRDIVELNERQWLRTPDFGKVSYKELKRLLEHHGLSLASDPFFDPPPPAPIFPSVHERLTRIETAVAELQVAMAKGLKQP